MIKIQPVRGPVGTGSSFSSQAFGLDAKAECEQFEDWVVCVCMCEIEMCLYMLCVVYVRAMKIVLIYLSPTMVFPHCLHMTSNRIFFGHGMYFFQVFHFKMLP